MTTRISIPEAFVAEKRSHSPGVERARKLCDEAIADLISQAHGEVTIKITARNSNVVFAEVVTTAKHKLD